MPKIRFRNRPVSSINSEHTNKYIHIYIYTYTALCFNSIDIIGDESAFFCGCWEYTQSQPTHSDHRIHKIVKTHLLDDVIIPQGVKTHL